MQDTTQAQTSKRTPGHVGRRDRAWYDWHTGRAVDAGGRGCALPKRASVRILLERMSVLALTGRFGHPDMVYVCGPMPGQSRDGMRRWAWGLSGAGGRGLPEGWDHGRHFWPVDGAPVLRYRRPAGPDVEVHFAESWGFGPDDTPEGCYHALTELGGRLAGRWRGAVVLGTPVLTGRYTMRRAVPDEDRVVWEARTLERVRATAGQHRFEWLRPGGNVPAVAELDMRLAYGTLTANLGAGPEVWYGQDSFDPLARARWDISFRVPHDWPHPYGLLPVPDPGNRLLWSWPAEPGTEHSTWADGAEVAVALDAGWPVKVYAGVGPERPQADPLGAWGKSIAGIALALKGAGEELAYRAARAVLVQGIGGLVGREQLVYRVLPFERAGDVPNDAIDAHRIDGHVTWAERAPSQAGDMTHPEWAAGIWGKCRARLLWKRDGTGALNLPDEDVLGFRGDCLYLARDPGWPDRGRPGEWRTKWSHPGPLEVRSLPDYDALRHRERALEARAAADALIGGAD